jgi:hypothetical protein
MNQTIFILGAFPLLGGILIFVISSNVYAYAQQQLSPSLAADSSSSNSTSVSNTISPELKAKMCDPSNPSLKVVNTTESRICGIPKTVKPHSLSSAVTPPTSAAVSLPPQQQTTITKPTTTAPSVDSAPPKQQQQIATTNKNNNTNTSLLPTGGASRATISPVSNPSNKSLSSSSQSSAIAPQIKAVNQQHKQHTLTPPITLINGTKGTNSTAGQNYTFATSSPAATSDKPLYLGYHDTTTTTSSAHGNSGSKHNDNTDSKHHTHRSTRSASDDNSSEGKDTTKRFSIPHIKIATPDIGSTATDTKPFTPFSPIRIPLPSNDFTEKKTTHSTKLSHLAPTISDSTDEDPKVGVSPTNHHHSRSVDKSSSTHTKPPFFPPPHIIVNTKEHSSDTRSSSHTDFGRGLLSSSPSPSDLGSDIRSKVDSFIRNSLGGVRHGIFG